MTFRFVKCYGISFGARISFFNYSAWKRGLSIEINFWRWHFGVYV